MKKSDLYVHSTMEFYRRGQITFLDRGFIWDFTWTRYKEQPHMIWCAVLIRTQGSRNGCYWGCSPFYLFSKRHIPAAHFALVRSDLHNRTLLPTDSHQEFWAEDEFSLFLISWEITTLWDTEDCRLPASSCAHQKIHILFSLRALNAVISFSSPSWPPSWIFCLLAFYTEENATIRRVSLLLGASLKRVSLDGGGCKSTHRSAAAVNPERLNFFCEIVHEGRSSRANIFSVPPPIWPA